MIKKFREDKVIYKLMKITTLHTELSCFQEANSGFSLLIEVAGKRILFDLSYRNDIYKNAEKAGISLGNIDYIVLSHSHIDHTEGLRFFDFAQAKNLLAHPDCFKDVYHGGNFIGCALKVDYLKRKTNVILSKEPYWIEKDKVVFLGEIPRKNNFEAQNPVGNLQSGEADFVLEDSAIAIKTKQGIVIITGCSHSGICNIIEYAKVVCGENKIHSIIGGFHLFEDALIEKTIAYLKTQDVGSIYAAHCCSDFGFKKFSTIGSKRLKTLETIEF
ncbi:MAG: MBL fold metallo-hydrolase [Candidatus Gracilibacteria bacterium]